MCPQWPELKITTLIRPFAPLSSTSPSQEGRKAANVNVGVGGPRSRYAENYGEGCGYLGLAEQKR